MPGFYRIPISAFNPTGGGEHNLTTTRAGDVGTQRQERERAAEEEKEKTDEGRESKEKMDGDEERIGEENKIEMNPRSVDLWPRKTRTDITMKYGIAQYTPFYVFH